jgi:hypothetical protein
MTLIYCLVIVCMTVIVFLERRKFEGEIKILESDRKTRDLREALLQQQVDQERSRTATAIRLAEEHSAQSSKCMKEMHEMLSRNTALQDQLIAIKYQRDAIVNHQRAHLILGAPHTWSGGQQMGKEIRLTIKAPKDFKNI